MSFLLPMAAWLGLLSLPIIGFYLLKTRQRRKLVSTLLFWNQLKPKIENSPFWRKLRRWLSLLLQLLIFALILLGLMHPAFEWEQRAPQRVVAILDNSASMAASRPTPSRWQEARSQLDATLSRLRLADEMAVITAENPPRILSGWTSSKRELRAALDRVELLPTGTDPRAALELARELTALRENARVEIFSDSVWPLGAEGALQPGMGVQGVDPEKPTNVGFTLFAIRRSPAAPGDWQLDAEVVSPTTYSGQLELLRDGQTFDVTPVECQPGQPWRKSWRGAAEGAVEFTARLTPIAGDLLATDNQASCRLEALAPLQIGVVGPADSFLSAVLDSIPLVKWSQLDEFPATLPPELDLIITTGDALPAEKPRGALLLINPSRSGFWGERKGSLKEAPVTDVSRLSQLTRHAGLGQVAISEATAWTPAPGSEVLVASLTDPLIFGQWDRDPRWLVLGFDPAQSDLPLRTAFPVLMSNLLQSVRDEKSSDQLAAVLPGRIESELTPLATATSAESHGWWGPIFPGWWLALALGLIVLVAEWALYHRRITD